MRKYLVNSTYCIYLLEVKELYFDDSILTIKDVIEEVKHEQGIVIDASLVPIKKAGTSGKTSRLSNTDMDLLQTAKKLDYVLVTDDQKLIKAAHSNKIHSLDTPHFIHRLLIEKKWSEERALDALNQLKTIYNRVYIIEKVINDIEKWR